MNSTKWLLKTEMKGTNFMIILVWQVINNNNKQKE